MKHIDKPWGWEEILETNPKYTMKLLHMKEGRACSLQYHKYKKETVYVLEGQIQVQIDKEYVRMFPGNYITIDPGTVHRMTGIVDSLYLEASTSELDDVVRIKDNYGRV